MAVKITNLNFDEVVLKSEKPVLLDFWATWCGPCQMIAPTIEKISNEHPEFLIGKVNVDEESALAMKFNIVSIPTLVAIKNGEVTGHIVGLRPEADILKIME